MRYSELKKKDVVNIVTGASFGKPTDLLIDERRGTVTAICVPAEGSGGIFSFKKDSSTVIPWQCIEKLGDDVILVRVESFVKSDGRSNEKNGEIYS